MKRYTTFLILFFAALLLSSCSNKQDDKQQDQKIVEINPQECKDGYTLTRAPYLAPEPQYYCKINKEWQDFGKCSKQEECGEGFECLARIDAKEDLRCVPSESYLLDCWCTPDSNCVCT